MVYFSLVKYDNLPRITLVLFGQGWVLHGCQWNPKGSGVASNVSRWKSEATLGAGWIWRAWRAGEAVLTWLELPYFIGKML